MKKDEHGVVPGYLHQIVIDSEGRLQYRAVNQLEGGCWHPNPHSDLTFHKPCCEKWGISTSECCGEGSKL